MTEESTEAYVRLLEGKSRARCVDSWVNFLSGWDWMRRVQRYSKWSLNSSPARDHHRSTTPCPKEGSSARGSREKKEEMDVQWQLKDIKAFDRKRWEKSIL